MKRTEKRKKLERLYCKIALEASDTDPCCLRSIVALSSLTDDELLEQVNIFLEAIHGIHLEPNMDRGLLLDFLSEHTN